MKNIGDKTWFMGDEVTIISEPYEIYGGLFQDAKTAAGKVVSIATKEQRDADAKKAQAEHKEQQAAFKRIKN